MSKSFEDWKEEAIDKCRLMESTVLDMLPGEKLIFVVLSREPFERFDSFGEFKEKWIIMSMTETIFEKTGAVGTTDGSVKIDFFAPNVRLDKLMELADSRSYTIVVK